MPRSRSRLVARSLCALGLALLCGCTAPGTWSFPLTTGWRQFEPEERLVAMVLLGPFILLVPAVDVVLLPVTATHDVFFLDEPPAAPAAPTAIASSAPGR